MKEMLRAAIGRLGNGRVLVIGDVAIDEMVYGATARLSREAPVLILNHRNTDIILGAAGNAAHNVARLRAKRTGVVGLCGADHYGGVLLEALRRDGVDPCGMVEDAGRPTSVKTRISGIANQSVTQQIVRIDRESRDGVTGALENRLLDTATRLLPEFDACLLSDYGLGVVTPAMIERVRKVCHKHGILLAVDSQQSLAQFKGAAVLTPNQPEAEQNLGYAIDTPERLLRGGQDLLAMTQAESVLITRGGEGMSLFEKSGDCTDIPVFNRSEVFDVTGAGDTVVGTLTLAMATGAALPEAAVLGNLAASIVVRRFGASTTTPEELLTALEELDDGLLGAITRRRCDSPVSLERESTPHV